MPVDREREALDEMGATEVSVPIAGVVVAAFLVLTLVPGLAHLVRSPGPLVEKGAAIPMALVAKPTRPFEASRDTLQAIDGFEGELRNGSPLAAWVRPRVQGVFYDAAGVGNVQVVVGQDAPDTERSGPVLYFRPSVRHAMGEPFLDPERHDRVRRGGPAWESPPEPDPRPAVRQLADDLAMHGVELPGMAGLRVRLARGRALVRLGLVDLLEGALAEAEQRLAEADRILAENLRQYRPDPAFGADIRLLLALERRRWRPAIEHLGHLRPMAWPKPTRVAVFQRIREILDSSRRIPRDLFEALELAETHLYALREQWA